MYRIIFDEDVIKYLERIPKEHNNRIFNKLSSTKDNPLHFFERLKSKQCFKLRVGKYRVIADINQNEKTIDVLHIELRKKAYNKLWKFKDERKAI